MEKTAEDSLTQYPFTDYFTSNFAVVSYHKALKTILCQLTAEYVPIEYFQQTFHKISELLAQGDYHKFIFDKRSLKAFHQPSMEWYFVVWKKEMFAKGLKIHRKILPSEAWFKKSIDIAKIQIYRDHQDLIIEQLDIKYCDSILEAIKS